MVYNEHRITMPVLLFPVFLVHQDHMTCRVCPVAPTTSATVYEICIVSLYLSDHYTSGTD